MGLPTMALNSFFTSFLSQMIYVLLHKQTTITTRSTCIISTECIRIHLIYHSPLLLYLSVTFSQPSLQVPHTCSLSLSLGYLHCSIFVIIKISFNFLSFFFSSQTTFCSTNQIPRCVGNNVH